MSKEPPKDPIDHAGFQLTREFLHIPEHVTAQSLGIKLSGLAGMAVNKFDFDPIIDQVIVFLNDLDLNEDHKSDVAELAPIVLKLIPVAVEVAPLLNLDAVKADLMKLPEKFPHYFKDAAAATAKMGTLFTVLEEALVKFAPKA